MEGYDVMQVCLNGHMITEFAQSQPESKRDHCQKCGAPTITHCTDTACSTKIKGHLSVPGVIGGYRSDDDPPPAFCEKCGKPYPWTKNGTPGGKSNPPES